MFDIGYVQQDVYSNEVSYNMRSSQITLMSCSTVVFVCHFME